MTAIDVTEDLVLDLQSKHELWAMIHMVSAVTDIGMESIRNITVGPATLVVEELIRDDNGSVQLTDDGEILTRQRVFGIRYRTTE